MGLDAILDNYSNVDVENRTAAEGSLLRILGVRGTRKIDADRLVELFASEHWGIYRWRFRQVAKQLQVAKTIEQGLVASGLPHDDHTLYACASDGQLPIHASLGGKLVLESPYQCSFRTALAQPNVLLDHGRLVLMNILTAFWFVCGRSLQRMLVRIRIAGLRENLDLLPPISLQITFGLLVSLQVYWLDSMIWKTSFGPLKGRVG